MTKRDGCAFAALGRALLRAALAFGAISGVAWSQDLDARLAEFWSAATVEARDEVARGIVASDASVDDVVAGLRRGRAYSADAPTGLLLRERIGVGGVRHPYAIVVPKGYTPDRRWPVRFELHGGMGAEEWKELDGAWTGGWTRCDEWIVVLPAGWWDSMWWEWSQVENFEAILREVRATWNIDEDRVVLSGGSDGGAAVFFQAMRTPDRWAGYAGTVAPPDRLVRAEFRPDGQMHVSNLDGQLFHLTYGERDDKVPLRFIEKYMALFAEHGAQLDWVVLEKQGHSLSLPPERLQQFIDFLRKTQRDPLPDRLSWAAERTDRYARRSWLVIDALEVAEAKHKVDESNLLPRWGTSLQLRGPTAPRVPWGRVEVERQGNRVLATTRRVDRFRLLISPDEFDLEEPIVVEVDGVVRFEGLVQPSVATLLHWAARDDERTRLFVGEVVVE